MAQKSKYVERCGFLAILVMVVLGTIFGSIGVILAHIGMKFYPDYYLVLIFPLFIGIVLGIGFSLGARIGRCCRINIVVFLIVLLFSMITYGSFLFLNHYHDSLPEQPQIVLDERFRSKRIPKIFLLLCLMSRTTFRQFNPPKKASRGTISASRSSIFYHNTA
jgi:hypothetical protein